MKINQHNTDTNIRKRIFSSRILVKGTAGLTTVVTKLVYQGCPILPSKQNQKLGTIANINRPINPVKQPRIKDNFLLYLSAIIPVGTSSKKTETLKTASRINIFVYDNSPH